MKIIINQIKKFGYRLLYVYADFCLKRRRIRQLSIVHAVQDSHISSLYCVLINLMNQYVNAQNTIYQLENQLEVSETNEIKMVNELYYVKNNSIESDQTFHLVKQVWLEYQAIKLSVLSCDCEQSSFEDGCFCSKDWLIDLRQRAIELFLVENKDNLSGDDIEYIRTKSGYIDNHVSMVRELF